MADRLIDTYTRLAAASDKAYQLLAHGQWFSPGTPASSTTKTGRHDIAEILLKVSFFYDRFLLMWCNFKFEGVLFQSDSRCLAACVGLLGLPPSGPK